MQANAKLTVKLSNNKSATIALEDVLDGKTKQLWKGRAVVRLVTSAEPIADFKTEDDYPAAAYGPDGTMVVVYNSYTVRRDSRRIEQPNLPKQPESFRDLYVPELADQVWFRSQKAGKWSQPIAVTGSREDIVRAAVAVNGDNEVWVVYSAGRQGNYDLYARRVSNAQNIKMGKEERLTTGAGPDLTPVMCTDASGNVFLAWQSWDEKGQASIGVMSLRQGKWSEPQFFQGPNGNGNCWSPAIAASPNGEVALAFDHYDAGDYDIQLVVMRGDKGTGHVVANSPKLESRPALAYDQTGKLWITHEVGPEKWGKDYGAQDSTDGNPLYNQRNVRVLFLDNGQLYESTAELPSSNFGPPQLPFERFTSNRYEKATRYAYPKIGIDGNGKVWLSYRQSFGTRYSTHPGAYWVTFVRRLEGSRWSEPVQVHHSSGLLDHRPVLLPHVGGGLVVVHNTDGRLGVPEVIDNQVYASLVNLPPLPKGEGDAFAKLQIKPRQISKEVKHERDIAARFKAHRIKNGTKSYRLLRGEYHRHTEISWDGAPDGSLEDMFRYAIDAAGMEWIGNGDHDNGAGREYPWWLTQETNFSLTRRRCLHADVHLRTQRALPAWSSQCHVRQTRDPHIASTRRW